MPSQKNVRNNGLNQKKYTATIEHENIGTLIQNHAGTYDENVNDDIMEIDFHRDQLETHRKFENQEENLLKPKGQLKSLEGHPSLDVLKKVLKEISLNNKRRRFDYEKNLGIEQHNKQKQKMKDYSQRRTKIAKTNLKIKQCKLLIEEGPYYIFVLLHRCFYRRSVLIFDCKKYSSELDKTFLVKSFDTLFYICNT